MAREIEFIRNIAKITYITYSVYEAFRNLEKMEVAECNEPHEEIMKICAQMKEHKSEDFHMVSRMSMESYNILLTFLYEKLEAQNRSNTASAAITEQTRLDLTILNLAHGLDYAYLASAYKLSKKVVAKIINDTINAICNELQYTNYLCEDWQNLSTTVAEEIGLPHCLGAIDMQEFQLNNDNAHKMSVLLSCDADLYFTHLHVFKEQETTCGELERILQQLNLPKTEETKKGSHNMLPYYFVSNNTKLCHAKILTPFSHDNLKMNQLNFNEYLTKMTNQMSTAKRVLTSRWKLLGNWNLSTSYENTRKTLTAIVLLHNFLLQLNDDKYYDKIKHDFIKTNSNTIKNKTYNIHPLAIRIRDDLIRNKYLSNA